jgi:hypothetical protein
MKIFSPSAIRKSCQRISNDPKLRDHIVKPGMRGYLTGLFNNLLATRYPDPDIHNLYRYTMWGWLFTPDNEQFCLIRSSLMTPRMWIALSRWKSYVDPGGVYRDRESFEQEFWWVLTKSLAASRVSRENPQILMSELVDDDKIILTTETDMLEEALNLGAVISDVIGDNQKEEKEDTVIW